MTVYRHINCSQSKTALYKSVMVPNVALQTQFTVTRPVAKDFVTRYLSLRVFNYEKYVCNYIDYNNVQ